MPFILPADCYNDKQLINMQPMVVIGDRCDVWNNLPFTHRPIQATISSKGNTVKVEPEPILLNATLAEVNGKFEWKYEYNLDVLSNMEPTIKMEKNDSEWEYDGNFTSTTDDSDYSVEYNNFSAGRLATRHKIPPLRLKKRTKTTKRSRKRSTIHQKKNLCSKFDINAENETREPILKNYTTRSGRIITMYIESD